MAEPDSLRRRCVKRLEGMKTLRQPYEDDWRQIASHAQPARSRFLNNDTNKNTRQRNKAIYDSHAIQAFRKLTGGMTSGLSPSHQPWFKLATYDAALMEEAGVKEWLTETERRMYAFLAGTNFYGAARTSYSELGLFGTAACVMIEHQQRGAVCHALTAGEYWIAQSDAMVPDTLYRRVPMTVAQAVQSFREKVSKRVRNLYDASRYEECVNVWHAIEPNTERDASKVDARNMAWRSLWWDDEDGPDTLLRQSGFPEQPFWAPRWDTTGSDVWGSSPGMEALPDMRELQLQSKRKGEATDYHIWPEIVTDPKIKLKRQPRAVTSAASFDQSQVSVPYQVPYQAIAAVGEDIEKCKRAIDAASYADLFMAITDMPGIQPRNVEEIAARNEEKMTQLGPVIDRVNNEMLAVAIDRVFAIMSRGGLLPEAPESLSDVDLKIEFVSILTQMQRMVGIGQIERTAGFVGNLMGAFPEAGDKLNVDEMIDEYADRAGTPQKLIRSDDDVEKLRQQRLQAQQAERALQAAPAVKDYADAGALLSEVAANPPAAPL